MATVSLRQMLSLRKSLRLERYYPLFFAALAAIVSFFSEIVITAEGSLLLSASISFGAITSGFVGTTWSILTSLGTIIMQRVRRTGYIKILRLYMGWGLASGVILSCVSMIGLLFSLQDVLFTSLWCASTVFCIACLYRLAIIMLYIFSDPENLPE